MYRITTLIAVVVLKISNLTERKKQIWIKFHFLHVLFIIRSNMLNVKISCVPTITKKSLNSPSCPLHGPYWTDFADCCTSIYFSKVQPVVWISARYASFPLKSVWLKCAPYANWNARKKWAITEAVPLSVSRWHWHKISAVTSGHNDVKL